MQAEAIHYIRRLIKISSKIKSRKFDSFQQGEALIRDETSLMCTLVVLFQHELGDRHRRYFE